MDLKFAGDKTVKQTLKTAFELRITTLSTVRKIKHFTTSY